MLCNPLSRGIAPAWN